jgi:hypothetical protein
MEPTFWINAVKSMSFSKMDYCQFLLSSQVNYTLTHLAEHLQSFSHDTINRYLSGVTLRPHHLWEKVQPLLEQHPEAFLLFDDTVLDKSFGPQIEMTQKQWSGNTHGLVQGIGLVCCVYVNPQTGHFWVLDYRLYDPQQDGKSKLQHVMAMFESALRRRLLFQTVLMDSWYASKELMLLFDRNGKTFYCPIKSDRQVDDSGGIQSYRRVDSLEWSEAELVQGKRVKLRGFPKDYKVQLFRVVVSSHRTEHVVTNDVTQASAQGAREVCAVRWKIEEMHREAKQLTGLESCQCRKARIQRNHIHCALLVWTRLKQLSYHLGRSTYEIKRGLLSDYLIQQLKNPSVSMTHA